MLTSIQEVIELYLNDTKFSSLVEFTAAKTQFRTELIEKDYLCSLILLYLSQKQHRLIFKDGTSLSKVHADFYRMSEDLDFSFDCNETISRNQRRIQMKPYKELVAKIADDIYLQTN